MSVTLVPGILPAAKNNRLAAVYHLEVEILPQRSAMQIRMRLKKQKKPAAASRFSQKKMPLTASLSGGATMRL